MLCSFHAIIHIRNCAHPKKDETYRNDLFFDKHPQESEIANIKISKCLAEVEDNIDAIDI